MRGEEIIRWRFHPIEPRSIEIRLVIPAAAIPKLNVTTPLFCRCNGPAPSVIRPVAYTFAPANPFGLMTAAAVESMG
jgi:hypothetical protein